MLRKVLLTLCCFAVASIGFIVKLPHVFRYHDKELHATFYFFAAAFLNILFVKNSISKHLIAFLFLLLFGVMIEYAQEFSKIVFHIKHAPFDIEDILTNSIGLILFSICWFYTYRFIHPNESYKMASNTKPGALLR